MVYVHSQQHTSTPAPIPAENGGQGKFGCKTEPIQWYVMMFYVS